MPTPTLRPSTPPTDADLPLAMAASLDASAADLRHGRTEDAEFLLARIDARLEAGRTRPAVLPERSHRGA